MISQRPILPRLFVGNFEFEHELALAERQVLPTSRAARRVAAELASVWLSIAREGDCLWMPEPPDPEFQTELLAAGFPSVRFVSSDAELSKLLSGESLACAAWGWSQDIRDWARGQKLECDPPDLEPVRFANSRQFSFGLETQLGVALPGTAECDSLEACETALTQFRGDEPWVIKSDFGMSARERILGRGPELKPAQITWITKQLESGRTVFLEPWVTKVAEAGLQFDVPKEADSAPKCLGITPLLTVSSGIYRGSRFDPAAETEHDWSDALKFGQIAASCAKALGYFGPLGIDAMWYRDLEGQPRLRPLQDFNARWTMGRLSLGFRTRLQTGECGIWRHVRCPAESLAQARTWWQNWEDSLPAGIRWIRTSPISLGGHVTQHATGMLIANDTSLLHTISHKLS